jgi:hypothetical protein
MTKFSVGFDEFRHSIVHSIDQRFAVGSGLDRIHHQQLVLGLHHRAVACIVARSAEAWCHEANQGFVGRSRLVSLEKIEVEREDRVNTSRREVRREHTKNIN